MATEYCPRCKTHTTPDVTVSEDETVDDGGKTVKTKTKVYHCSECKTFVRSENLEE